MKAIADGLVVTAIGQCMGKPIACILSGELWGSGAFLAGAIIVSAVLFGEFYFRESDDGH